jgi:hypothetical protein
VCPKCGLDRELRDFGKDVATAKGISSWCKPCKKRWRKDWRQKNPEEARSQDFKNDFKKNYGITPEDYWRLFEAQGGRCACCGVCSEDHRRGLHVDHDHTSGQVRGLLCTKCNPGLGYFDDSVEKLEMAITYLKKFKK